MLRKGGGGGPSTIADLPFIFDPPFFDIPPFKTLLILQQLLTWIMTFKYVESPMGSKDTVLRKLWIFAPSDGPKPLFKYLFLTIIDNIYKTVYRI